MLTARLPGLQLPYAQHAVWSAVLVKLLLISSGRVSYYANTSLTYTCTLLANISVGILSRSFIAQALHPRAAVRRKLP
jgi:hypothetical protein